MATVDQGYAAWLRSDRLQSVATAASVDAWGARGAAIEALTPFADAAGAAAELARLQAFHAGPIVRDKAVVPGERRDLLHRCITLVGGQLGYDAGVPAFVIGVAEQDNMTTVLTVLRRL